jgi:hypothetical protein
LEMVSWSNIPRSKSGTGYYRAKEEDTRSNRSLNRLYVIHGVDENEGLILATPEESLSRASSHSFSRSQSLSHSSSEASIDSGSIRLHSLHSEWGSGAPGNDPTRSSSSCCGVNLRSSPVPQSPPYEQSPSLKLLKMKLIQQDGGVEVEVLIFWKEQQRKLNRLLVVNVKRVPRALIGLIALI